MVQRNKRKIIERLLTCNWTNTSKMLQNRNINRHFKKLVHSDIIPQPLDHRKYIINGTDTDEDNKKSILSNVRHKIMLIAFGLQLMIIISVYNKMESIFCNAFY